MSRYPFVKLEQPGMYQVTDIVSAKDIIAMAQLLVDEWFNGRKVLVSTSEAKKYLAVKLASLEYEVFGVIFMDSQHGVIELDTMFRGTIDAAAVFPREVVKKALACNAAAVIFFHNHPSGVAEPSAADKQITYTLKDALELVGIKSLDHLVVGSSDVVSFAERGLL